jgi:mono/diheme cytochrome c family protein
MLETIGFLAPWILIGIGVVFVAFSGGPGAAREAYLTRGTTFFKIAIPAIFLGFAVAIPAAVIAARGDRAGNSARLHNVVVRDESPRFERGKQIFIETCAACHNLDAVNARGITGPDLDEVGKLTEPRVLNAIKVGGTGQGRMPAGLLGEEQAKDVAYFLSRVAGK